MPAPISKTRRRAGNFMIGLCSCVLIFSSSLKFAHVPKVVAQMASMGYRDETLLLVAVLEILTAIVFLTPGIRSVGVLVISSYLGGAIASHVASGQYRAVVTPMVCLGLAWMGTWLRHPEALWSVRANAASGLHQRDIARSSSDPGIVFMSK